MEKVVILSGTRSPIGKYKGALKEFSAVELGTKIAQSAIKKAGISPKDIDQSIIGNVLSSGNGQNIARQIAINSGLPESSPAMTLNEVCGSGLKAVILGMQQIQLGEAQVILTGGTESMSQAPLLQKYQAESDSYAEPISSMVHDGLTDAFSQKHMGLTAEKVAETFSISRSQQDAFALQSQTKAAAAQKAGKFTQEITAITLADGQLFQEDEGIRANSSLERLATLKTVFKADGSVTAGNASTLNDGAAMLVLASESYAKAHGLNYLATIEGYSEIGIDPSIMGISPIKALQRLSEKTGRSLTEIDLFEINEAFAASSLVVQNELNLSPEKVNIYGGGISLGHPIGASGARLLVTLLAELFQEEKSLGAASLCVGGGLGLAMLIKKETPTTPDTPAKKFYQQTRPERLAKLTADGILSQNAADVLLKEQLLDTDIANNMIENQIGEAELPLGVAQNFLINNEEVVVPMVTEEPSVIAAASNAAKIIAQSGGFTTATTERVMRGQIVFQKVQQPQKLTAALAEKKAELQLLAAEVYPSIVLRGGGVRAIKVRQLEDFVSLDVLVDTQDAMGANMINTILEGLAQQLRSWFPEEEILFSILSNYPTEALSQASCRIPFDLLTTKNFAGELVAEKIVLASQFAKLDAYRGATHNKGIMNGIDAVVLATGNDTRAVAAGIHTFASRNGSYQGLTDWQIEGNSLVGKLEIPVAVGTVGGATKVLPKAHIAMEILNFPTAAKLAEIITAVGLGQNLAAIKALVTDGIQKGHMNLHMRQLAIAAGAVGSEIATLTKLLQAETIRNLAVAQKLLAELRK
ncbi:hydroxymethylglutaryl-CoA reductase, degradative [Enterococcus sp. HY326]|uniref:hydroxymethylglutaryl-CoA reductase, degradative n=1 Tax=Enterococcus sp. HY326 TaxID=2971265 RepID=UPI00223EE6DA|nr:hydroxymethylglutaryl-CoA reductase, degradative [Enterococcus sp. HY326]